MPDSAIPTRTPDQIAAEKFLSELRTRITTQPLPYQYGTAERALESLWEIFAQAREAMKGSPGCEQFSALATELLNVHLRPVTAKWHAAYAAGRLGTQDGADAFRGDLGELQLTLRTYADALHRMAYGTERRDALVGSPMPEPELDRCEQDLAFGLPGWPFTSTDETDAINRDEADEVHRRRKNLGVTTAPGLNAVGLALSGGGIRSATFCLGVVQVLADKGLLKGVDFLSTVSGGGYTGSFLTRQLGGGAPQTDVAGPRGPDPAPVRYLRLNAKFLAARTLKESWGMVVATLAGMVLNWSVPLLLVVLAALGAVWGARVLAGVPVWPGLVGTFAVLSGLALIAYGVALRVGKRAALRVGGWLGVLLALCLASGAGWALAAGFHAVPAAVARWPKTPFGVGALLAALTAAGPTLLRFLPILKDPRARSAALAVLLHLAALVVPVVSVLAFYACCELAVQPRDPALPWWHPLHAQKGFWFLAEAGVVLFLVDLVLNVNQTGPHRLYRNGLARSFVQTTETEADVPLASVNPSSLAPYHLINTALNIPGSTHLAVRDRRCDFFLFSKHWTGSPSVGYYKTTAWKAGFRSLDLATAMAISGAAVSSYMGLGSMPTLTALLALLNVRLGYWIRQPGRWTFGNAPGFSCLLREMLGVGMSEESAWLNLSDGGHVENMGVYELLRRRCKYIVCVDGEADPQFAFQGFMTLVRHAQIDFGVRIEPQLDHMRSDPATGINQAHTHLCRIHYPEVAGRAAGLGLLLYLKLSVTGNETEVVKRYRRMHPAFPHESTLDQFFDQEQFEAYRELGVHVAEGTFSPALMDHAALPTTFADWFRRLAKNFLEPEEGSPVTSL